MKDISNVNDFSNNSLIHNYMGVNLDIIYKIVIKDIPELLDELNKTTH